MCFMKIKIIFTKIIYQKNKFICYNFKSDIFILCILMKLPKNIIDCMFLKTIFIYLSHLTTKSLHQETNSNSSIASTRPRSTYFSPKINVLYRIERIVYMTSIILNFKINAYPLLLSKIFKAHINVEYCNLVKSIKYICKYVNKGSDMAVFREAADNSHDEIVQYQIGRNISTNEALWRIYSYPMHERFPAVVHLAVIPAINHYKTNFNSTTCTFFFSTTLPQRFTPKRSFFRATP
ncbi:hypothetical protein AGLY_006382, partial [Aphis glycines]